MKIDSFVPGRVRLRSPLFKETKSAAQIADGLMSIPGVARAEVNRLTGGLLLEYDARALTVSRLISAAPLIEKISEAEELDPPERSGMIDSLLAEIKEMMI